MFAFFSSGITKAIVRQVFHLLFIFLVSFSHQLKAEGQALTVQWPSSIDGAAIHGTLWLPDGYDASAGEIPLVLWFNGGTGDLKVPRWWQRRLDQYGWMGLVVAGRDWTLEDDYGCGFRYSMAYFNHPDADIGPGEQDILDGVDQVISTRPIDPDRVYIMGFSLGGRGTYMMGLKKPDRFAAIAPMAPATDMFEVDIRTDTTRSSYPCRMALAQGLNNAQGIPGSGDFSDTARSIQSARFLIENARNLPVFHGHGTIDDVAINNTAPEYGPYMHGNHMLVNNDFNACHQCSTETSPCTSTTLQFCFGHTPTLTELNAMDPDGYQFGWMRTPVDHKVDVAWVDGIGVDNDQSAEGKEDPHNPGQLLGAFEFLSRQTRNSSPDTVVYKSYTDHHQQAYWTAIDIAHPWQNKPGAIRATRDKDANSVHVEVTAVNKITLNLPLAQLALGEPKPLQLTLQRLLEPTFDPALNNPGETLTPMLVLKGDFSALPPMQILQNGILLAPSQFTQSPQEISITAISIDQPVDLIIQGQAEEMQIPLMTWWGMLMFSGVILIVGRYYQRKLLM